MVADNALFEVVEERDWVFTRFSKRGRRRTLDIGTEVVSAYVRKTGAQPDIKVKYQLTNFPVFD
jgi:hypothetical protein